MRKQIVYGMLVVSAISLALMGFQCSSAEMTSAKLYIQRKEYQNAEAQLQKEVAKNPKNEEAWFLLGQIRYEQKNYLGMKEALDKSAEIGVKYKNDIKNYILQSWVNNINDGVKLSNDATDQAGYDKTVAAFKMAYDLLPDSLLSSFNLGMAYFRAGDEANGIKYVQETLDKHNYVEAAKKLGRVYFDKAFELKEKFRAENQELLATWTSLRQFYEGMKASDVVFYIKAPATKSKPAGAKPAKGKKTVAEEWTYPQYNLVILVDDGTVEKITYSKPYTPAIDSSLVVQSQQEYDKAIQVLKRGFTLAPADPVISEILTNSFINSGRSAEARDFIAERLKTNPDYKSDHYFMGRFSMSDKKFADAEKSFLEALRVDPAYTDAILELGNTYLEWGNYELEEAKKANKDLSVEKKYLDRYKQAVPYLEKFAEQNPDNLRIWDALVQIYARTGDTKKGEEAMKKADSIRENVK